MYILIWGLGLLDCQFLVSDNKKNITFLLEFFFKMLLINAAL